MNIQEYYQEVLVQAKKVMNHSLKQEKLAQANSFIEDVIDWRKVLKYKEESMILESIAHELQFALFSLACGLYRQSFMSLRRVLESSCAMVFFSAYELDFREWQKGNRDISWSELSNDQNGIFSKRWSEAFFPELEKYRQTYRSKSIEAYRNLSEYVHGNPKTWLNNDPNLSFDIEGFKYWMNIFEDIKEIIIFIICLRFMKKMEHEERDEIKDSVIENMGHIPEIRECFGLPVD